MCLGPISIFWQFVCLLQTLHITWQIENCLFDVTYTSVNSKRIVIVQFEKKYMHKMVIKQ